MSQKIAVIAILFLASAGRVLAEDQPTPATLAMATVGNGEGFESPIIRQLINEPERFLFKGDVNDKSAVEKWAGNTAHFAVAAQAGFVDIKFGGDIRIKQAYVVAFILGLDDKNNYTVTKYDVSAKVIPAESKAGSTESSTTTRIANVSSSTTNSIAIITLASSTARTLTVAASASEAQFLGDEEYVKTHPLESYQYFYVTG